MPSSTPSCWARPTKFAPKTCPSHCWKGKPTSRHGTKYHSAISELKKRLIRDALAEANGNYTEAAKALGVHPNYLHRLIRNLEMKAELRDSENE